MTNIIQLSTSRKSNVLSTARSTAMHRQEAYRKSSFLPLCTVEQCSLPCCFKKHTSATPVSTSCLFFPLRSLRICVCGQLLHYGFPPPRPFWLSVPRGFPFFLFPFCFVLLCFVFVLLFSLLSFLFLSFFFFLPLRFLSSSSFCYCCFFNFL
jgi:hypothetical protein